MFLKRLNKVFPSAEEGIAAFVLEKSGSIYLYVVGHEGKDNQFASMCWLHNTGRTPKAFNEKKIAKGKPPRLPIGYCFPAGEARIDFDNLSVRWHDQDIISVSDGDRVIAVILDYKSIDYRPYSRFCVQKCDYAQSLLSMPDSAKEILQKDGLPVY